MPKNYKQLVSCSMCRKMFTLPEKTAEPSSYASRRYCPVCSEKYFPKK